MIFSDYDLTIQHGRVFVTKKCTRSNSTNLNNSTHLIIIFHNPHSKRPRLNIHLLTFHQNYRQFMQCVSRERTLC